MKYKKMLIFSVAVTMAFSDTIGVSAATMKDLFDAEYYASANPDVKAAYGDDAEALWNHFITCGIIEGRNMNELLDVAKYRAENPDLSDVFGNDWDAYVNHYLNFGAWQGRNSGTDFDFLGTYGDQPWLSGDEILALWRQNDTQEMKKLEGFYYGYCIVEHDAAGNLVKITGYSEHGIKNSEYEYDATGNLISRAFYRSSRFGEGECYFREENVLDDTWNIKYDSNGNYQVTYVLYYNEGNDFAVSEGDWCVWEYDSAGNYQIIDTDTFGIRRIEGYNRFGDRVKTADYSEEGFSEGHFEYDDAGNCVKLTSYYNGSISSVRECEFEYDSLKNRDRIRKAIYYGGEGSISSWTEYEYDDAGNGKRVTYYNADGSVAEWEEWEIGDGYNTCISYNTDGRMSSRIMWVQDDSKQDYTALYYNANDGSRGTYWWKGEDDNPSNNEYPWEDSFEVCVLTSRRHIKFIPK